MRRAQQRMIWSTPSALNTTLMQQEEKEDRVKKHNTPSLTHKKRPKNVGDWVRSVNAHLAEESKSHSNTLMLHQKTTARADPGPHTSEKDEIENTNSAVASVETSRRKPTQDTRSRESVLRMQFVYHGARRKVVPRHGEHAHGHVAGTTETHPVWKANGLARSSTLMPPLALDTTPTFLADHVNPVTPVLRRKVFRSPAPIRRDLPAWQPSSRTR